MNNTAMHRRAFLGISASGALVLTLPTRVRSVALGRELSAPGDLLTLRDPRVTALAHTALDAARSAGAGYADIRLTYGTFRRFMTDRPDSTGVSLGMSVRALVNGYWGWAATPILSEFDAPRVGQQATQLAQVAARRGRPRSVEWGTIPVVPNGTWTTPIRIDPFEITIEEICDWMVAERKYIEDLKRFRGGDSGSDDFILDFSKQERVFLSTEGSLLTQTVYITGGAGGGVEFPAAQAGWEYLINPPVRERIRAELDRNAHTPRSASLPVIRTLDIGRYDIVFTANAMAQLLDATLAPAAQVDRALGYEANAGGTSYLGPDPFVFLGKQITSPLITISADRSSPTSLATIGWDDDGVVPEDFTLIKDGVFLDYQTTREQAPWLAPWYQKHGHPIHSHGCMASRDALTYPMQHTPNLTLHPGAEAIGLDDLIAGVERGLLVSSINVDMDFQCLNGLGIIGGVGGPPFYVIRHGRLVAVSDITIEHALQKGVIFRAPELWNAIQAIGGKQSVETHFEGNSAKGQPAQRMKYSIAAVPAAIKQQAVIDPWRKA